MFFILSKILSFLTQPFLWVLILLIYAWIVKIPRRKRQLRAIAVLVFIVFSNYFIAGQVMKIWEGRNTFKLDNTYSGVIVLGGYSSWNTRHQKLEFNESADRIIQAVRFYESAKTNRIILSGGSGLLLKPEEKESAMVHRVLIEMGVDDRHIIVEDSSRNTHENAVYTANLINRIWGKKPSNFLLITSAFHMRRAKVCFEKTNLDIDYYRVDFQIDDEDYDIASFIIPSTGAFYTWNQLIKEWLGYIAYWIKGYF